ncbi:MAG: hypothetical protein RLY57_208 [Candidatus Parcubacteria bacterium]|jgi:magnesium-transporting ATPase (P-type)
MGDIQNWYQSHRDLAHAALALIVVIILFIIFESGGKTSSTTSSGGKGFKKFLAQVMGFCVVCGVLCGLYWLWTTYIKGKHLDLFWLKYVMWGTIALAPLLLLWRFGFFGWFSDWWQRPKGDDTKRKPLWKSGWLWLVLCLTVAGVLGYWFRDNIWNWGIKWMPWSAIAGATILLIVVVLILKKLLKKKEGEEKPKDKKEKEKGKEKESATKKNILTSLWFWLFIVAVVGFISYYFQKEIEQWIRSGQWRHLPLWVYITGGLILLIMVLWVVGKERLGKFLAGAALIAIIALALNFVTSGFKGIIGEHSSTILTNEGKSGYIPQTIYITPDHPLQSVYKESWDGYMEYPQAGKVVWLYIPLNGKPVYQGGNLVVDQSRVLRMELGKPTHTTMERGQDCRWRFYWTEPGESATVTIKLN